MPTEYRDIAELMGPTDRQTEQAPCLCHAMNKPLKMYLLNILITEDAKA